MKIAPTARKILLATGMTLAGLVLLALLLAGAGYLYLQTQDGRERLVRLVEDLTAGTSASIDIEGVSPGLPSRLRLARLTISDRDGVWFSAQEIDLAWSPQALLGGIIRVRHLRVEHAEMLRAPVSPPEPELEIPREPLVLEVPELPTIRVGEISVALFRLAPAVAGRELETTIAGHLTSQQGTSDLELRLAPPEQTETPSLVTRGTYRRPSGELEISVELLRDPGGLLAHLLGLEPGANITADFHGKGPLSDWNADLSLTAEGLGDLAAALHLSARAPYGMDLEGVFRPPSQALPPELENFLGARTSFRLHARTDEGDILLEDSYVRSKGVNVDLRGSLDPEANTVDATLTAHFPTLGDEARRVGLVLENPAETVISVNGSLSGPTVRITTGAETFSAGPAVFHGLHLDIRSDLEDFAAGKSPSLAAEGTIRVDTFLLEGDDPIVTDATVRFKTSTDDFRDIRIASFDLKSNQADLRGNGSFDIQDLLLDVDYELLVRDPSTVRQYAGLKLDGILNLAGAVSGTVDQPQLSITGQGRLRDFQGVPKELTNLLGPDMALDLAVNVDGSTLTVSRAVVDAASLDARADAFFDFEAETWTADAEADLSDLSAAGEAVGIEADGSLQIGAGVKGGFSSFDARAEVRSPAFSVQGTHVRSLAFDASAANLPKQVAGRSGLQATVEGHSLRLRTDFALRENELRLRRGRITALGIRFLADLGLDISTGLVSGSVETASGTKLSRLELPTDLNPSGDLFAKAELSGSTGSQDMRLTIIVDKAGLDDVKTRRAFLEAALFDLATSPRGSAALQVQDLEGPEFSVENAQLDLSGTMSDAQLRLRADGETDVPFQVTARLEYADLPEALSFRLSHLTARYGKLPLNLRSPGTLLVRDDDLELESLVLQMNSGIIRLQGMLTDQNVDATASVQNLPLNLLDFLAPKPSGGTFSAHARLVGNPGAPTLESRFDVHELTGADKALQDPISLSGRLNLKPDLLRTSLHIGGISEGTGQVQLSLPVRFRLRPTTFEISDDAPLSGNVDAAIRLTTLSALLELDDQTLSGRARADLDIAGTFKRPLADGTLSVQNGFFEHIPTGTVLQDLTLEAEVQGRKVRIVSLTANDGYEGRVRGTGSADLDMRGEDIFSADVRLSDFRMVSMQEVTAHGDGDISLRGGAKQARLSGELTVAPVEVNIPENLPPSVAELDVKLINKPDWVPDLDQPETTESAEPAYPMNLDLSVLFPRRFFVRGQGLDAEFEGNLRITGTADEPRIKGALNVVRGRYSILQVTFNLAQGTLTFYGASPPEPTMNIVAEASTGDILARILLTGTPENPEITLESEPALPQDEIVSRLLFGKDAASLSPIQALRLAEAVQLLSGGSPGGGITEQVFGTTRDIFTLDDLTVGEGEGGGYSLKGGKYIQEDVYVTFDKGITSEEDKVGIQIELSPNVNLESEVGSQTGAGVGIFYKHDY